MHRVVLLSVFAAGLLLTLSACGGSTSSKSAQTTSTTSVTKNRTTTAETNTTTTAETNTTTPTRRTTTKRAATVPTSTSSTATKAATTTAPAKTPGLPATDCRTLSRLSARMGQAFTSDTPAADTKAYADFLQQLAKRAPAEIRGDFGVLADAYAKIASTVAEVYPKPGATPSADDLKKLDEVGKDLNSGAIKHAAGDINTWLQTHCSG